MREDSRNRRRRRFRATHRPNTNLPDGANEVICPKRVATMLKLATSGTELQFLVRRARDGRFLAVTVDSRTEATVVNAPTLKDLHIDLADTVTLKYGPNIRIRLLV